MADLSSEEIEKCKTDLNDLNRENRVGLLFNRMIADLPLFISNLTPTLTKVKEIYFKYFPSDEDAKNNLFNGTIYVDVASSVSDDYTSLTTFLARKSVIEANFDTFTQIELKLQNITEPTSDESLTLDNYRGLATKFSDQNSNLSEYEPKFMEIYNRCFPSADPEAQEKRAQEIAEQEIKSLGDKEISDEDRERIEKEAREKAAIEANDAEKRSKAASEVFGTSKKGSSKEEYGALYQEKKTWSASCLLLNLASQFASYKQDQPDDKKLPYQSEGVNSTILADGDPFAFLNKLTQYPSMKNFFDITGYELSALQPKIRLFKVIAGEDSTDESPIEEEIEINFDSYATKNDIENFTKDKNKRGFGAGIKNFNCELIGSNFFAVKKDIRASLEIFVSSFDELLRPRGTPDKQYSYADLALKTGDPRKPPAQEDSDPALKKLSFRLKAIVGWSYPHHNSNVLRSPEIKNAIYNSTITLNLTPVGHDFNINEDGSVSFKINYFAYVQDFFEQPAFNIFTDPEIMAANLVRTARIKVITRKCKTEEIGKIKEKEKERMLGEKKALLKSLITSLYNNKKIYHIKFTPEDVDRAIKEGPYFDLSTLGAGASAISPADSTASDVEKSVESSVEEAFERTEEEKKSAVANSLKTQVNDDDPNNSIVKVVFVSDLFDTILENIGYNLDDTINEISSQAASAGATIGEDEQNQISQEIDKLTKFKYNFEKFRMLLGPVELSVYEEGNRLKHISLGDIAISVDEFIAWLSDKVLGRDTIVYSLTTFSNDFFNNYLKNYLRNPKCYVYNTKQKIIFNQNIITSYRDSVDSDDQVTKKIKKLGYPNRMKLDNPATNSVLPILHPAGNPGDPVSNPGYQRQVDYLILSAGRVTPSERLVGDEAYDKNIGIFHYVVGKNSGLIKKVSLKKTDSKGLKEVRFEQEGYDGLAQMREVYDVDIETFCYPNLYPGTYIYLDPKGFSPNALTALYGDGKTFNLTKFGIGGYCMVTGVKHSFAEGKADTSISAKWVAGTTTYLDVDTEADKEGSSTTGDGSSACPNKEDLL